MSIAALMINNINSKIETEGMKSFATSLRSDPSSGFLGNLMLPFSNLGWRDSHLENDYIKNRIKKDSYKGLNWSF